MALPIPRAFAAMQRVRIRLARGDLVGAEHAVGEFRRWFPGAGDPLVAQAQVLFSENFDGMGTGVNPTGFTVNLPLTPTAGSLESTVIPFGSGNGLRLLDQLGKVRRCDLPRAEPIADARPGGNVDSSCQFYYRKIDFLSPFRDEMQPS